MMNQTAERMWDAGLAMLSPALLIDRFLDWVEQLGNAMMLPAQADNLSCQEMRIETRLDQFEA
jgi:hypothetical protein